MSVRRKLGIRPPIVVGGNWLPAFIMYTGIISKARQESGAALFKYLDLIYRAYVDFPGPVWLPYDENIRADTAKYPELPWDRRHHEYWLQNMTPYRPSLGVCFDSGHLAQRFNFSSGARSAAGQLVQTRLGCWKFNAKVFCSKKQ